MPQPGRHTAKYMRTRGREEARPRNDPPPPPGPTMGQGLPPTTVPPATVPPATVPSATVPPATVPPVTVPPDSIPGMWDPDPYPPREPDPDAPPEAREQTPVIAPPSTPPPPQPLLLPFLPSAPEPPAPTAPLMPTARLKPAEPVPASPAPPVAAAVTAPGLGQPATDNRAAVDDKPATDKPGADNEPAGDKAAGDEAGDDKAAVDERGIEETTAPKPRYQEPIPVGPAAVWLPARAAPVTVNGFDLRGGLIYVGTGLAAANTPGPEPGLVDPGLNADPSRPESRRKPPATLSYATSAPISRESYLRWLAAGRTGKTNPNNLFLFLYGLERRVFVDLFGGGTAREYLAIGAELRRLAEAYPPFQRKAAELLAVVDVLAMTSARDLLPPTPPELPTAAPSPALRVGLARFFAARRPVPPDWAFAWHAQHPDRRWRAPATRCREEFAQAFELHYKLAFPDGGLIVTGPQKQLVLAYAPASPGFAGRRISIRTGLPDVERMDGPVRLLHILAERAQHDLEGYARLIARRPEARGTPEAWALLPPATAQLLAARSTPAGG